MPRFGPIRRRELIATLRNLGFSKHEFMQRRNLVLTIPNPHRGDIGPELLSRILRQAGISRREWERV